MPALTSADLPTGVPQSTMPPGMIQALVAHLASAQPGAMGAQAALAGPSTPAVNGSSPVDLSPLVSSLGGGAMTVPPDTREVPASGLRVPPPPTPDIGAPPGGPPKGYYWDTQTGTGNLPPGVNPPRATADFQTGDVGWDAAYPSATGAEPGSGRYLVPNLHPNALANGASSGGLTPLDPNNPIEALIIAKQKQIDAMQGAGNALGAIGPNSQPGDLANAIAQANAAKRLAPAAPMSPGDVTHELGGNTGQTNLVPPQFTQPLSPVDQARLRAAANGQMNTDVGGGPDVSGTPPPDPNSPAGRLLAAANQVAGSKPPMDSAMASLLAKQGQGLSAPNAQLAPTTVDPLARTPLLDEQSRKMLVMNNAQNDTLMRKARLNGVDPQTMLDIGMQKQLLANPQGGQGAQQGAVPVAMWLRNPQLAQAMAQAGNEAKQTDIMASKAAADNKRADAALGGEQNTQHSVWAQRRQQAIDTARGKGEDVIGAGREFDAANPEPPLITSSARPAVTPPQSSGGGAANVPSTPDAGGQTPANSEAPPEYRELEKRTSDQVNSMLTPTQGQPVSHAQATQVINMLAPIADQNPSMVGRILQRNPVLREHLDEFERENNPNEWDFAYQLGHSTPLTRGAIQKSRRNTSIARNLRSLAGWPRPTTSVDANGTYKPYYDAMIF
jgi:hypothetical protein